MKKVLKLVMVAAALIAVPLGVYAQTCCATVVFDRETGEATNARSEKFFPEWYDCSGDCPTTNPGDWGPKE
jgi:hypothetical protein